MEKRRHSISIRGIVEFALQAGSLMPGTQLARMREGMLGHQARQRTLPDARSEVMVRGAYEGEIAVLDISGRIDALYTLGGIPIIEEIKLAPEDSVPEAAALAHRAQAIGYGALLAVPEAIIRVVYIRRDGSEVVSFEERMTAGNMRAQFEQYAAIYLRKVESRLRWMDVRDASIRTLAFPFANFRGGQRNMAAQVYWAIKSRKRLFAQAPTGTGKTAAALFPALKALGGGLTGQIFYLTARTTAQENAAQALERMRARGLRLRVLRMTAKEKICPCPLPADAPEGAVWRCDMLSCPYAIGFYDRLSEALDDMQARDDWSREAIDAAARAHRVCPFEFSLSLCELADAVVCDYNYAFDPGARIRRVFHWTNDLTLLVDEAHNLPDRARGMLTAALDSRVLRDIRRVYGNAAGRKKPLYTALTALIRLVESLDAGNAQAPPEDMDSLLEACMEEALAALREAPVGDLPHLLVAALGALERFDGHYSLLTEKMGRHTKTTLFCLDPAPHLTEITKKLRGTVYFSATMTPLPAWREAIGGTEDDGLLALPSPFPPENLLVLRCALATTYRRREQTADAVADVILAAVTAKPGNYLACFPSYAYLRSILAILQARGVPDVALHAQQGGMDDAAREDYLASFTPRQSGALLGLVVLGGIFGEGIDLPGDRLSGVIVVGVGLPQICPERELLRAYYDSLNGQGFAQSYRYPGMNKVLQAVGRVIRAETDRGIALLIDERFLQASYAELMPPWWAPACAAKDIDDMAARIRAFW